MVGVGRMAHAEEKAKDNNGKQRDHLFRDPPSFDKLQIFCHSFAGFGRHFENFHPRPDGLACFVSPLSCQILRWQQDPIQQG
jgi:hypothetical protein